MQYIGMNYINGDFARSRADFASINPSTEEVIGYFPESTTRECDEALAAARRAFPKWAAKSRIQRGEYFDRLCDLIKEKVDVLASAISIETGKSLNESKAEVIEALHMAQHCFGKAREATGAVISSELPERDSYVLRKPKGVVLSISPWNFPYAIAGFWSSAPAILEGNTVILKPSEETPMIGQVIADLYKDAGFPPGVFNLVHGSGKVGEYLLNSNVDHVCFTGSAQVGKIVKIACAQSEMNKTCSCEMGSKSAVVVFDDADMELALSASIASAFKLSGQRCVSAGRILVSNNIYDAFCERFAELASAIRVGDPFDDPAPMYGPLINKNQFERVMQFNDMTNRDFDCQVLLNGHRQGDVGFFLTPHVYKSNWGNKPFLKQEVFGPHVALIPFGSMDEAIDIYNDTEYGLSLGVITNDFKKAREMRNRCDFGLGYWNLPSIGAESHFPFSGVKGSGNGQPSGAGTFDCVVHKITWSVNHSDQLNMPQGLK